MRYFDNVQVHFDRKLSGHTHIFIAWVQKFKNILFFVQSVNRELDFAIDYSNNHGKYLKSASYSYHAQVVYLQITR